MSEARADIERTLNEYGEFVSWLFTANDDEKHAVEIVETLLGQTILELVAESLHSRLGEP